MIRHSVDFILDREKDRPDGKLRMRVRWGKDIRVSVNLGYRIEFDKWSTESQRVKANTTHGRKKIPAKQINSDIQSYERAAEDAFRNFFTEGTVPTSDEYRKELKLRLGRDVKDGAGEPLLRIVMESFIRKESALRSWSQHTERVWRELLSSFVKYDAGMPLLCFDGARFEDFYLWMTDVMGYANRTIRQRFMSVKQFLRWSKESGYSVPDDALQFSPRIKVAQRTVVWLDWDELQTLVRYRESGRLKPSWADVLDCFLLSCFTGLRVSDVTSLRWPDVGESSLRVLTSKTTDPLVIELNKYSRAVIDRHRDDARCGEFVMPDISHKNTPETLKRICRDAGIDSDVTITEIRAGSRRVEDVKKKWEVVSMHTGRRTFICNAVSMGISPLTIMKWTGHKDYASMKPYVDIASADKAKAMSVFDSK